MININNTYIIRFYNTYWILEIKKYIKAAVVQRNWKHKY